LNGVTLHSAYDPEKEANRFVMQLQPEFNPAYIVITEPALSWMAEPLRDRFPEAELCAVRYSKEFTTADKLWDIVFDGTQHAELFERKLFDTLGGEEGIYTTLFTSWQPSAHAFPEQQGNVWNSIRRVVLKSRSILATRTFFAGRWLKNSCLFCKAIRHPIEINQGNSCVIVAASGPSLKTSLPFLIRFRRRFFLVAVSSALEPLLYAGIIPDLCISVDGGYYARRHMEILRRTTLCIPLALSAEAAADPELVHQCPIVPLTYGDSPEQDFLACCRIHAMNAERNGTVSGTAVKFALSITTGPVYCCGLDLASAKGFQHTQPNALEKDASSYDCRIRPRSARLASAEFSAEALDIYRSWFSSQPFPQRLFRISDHFSFRHTLSSIPDTDWSVFSSIINSVQPSFSTTDHITDTSVRTCNLKKTVKDLSVHDEWFRNAFPADYLLWKRSLSEEAAELAHTVLEQKNNNLLQQILKVIDE